MCYSIIKISLNISPSLEEKQKKLVTDQQVIGHYTTFIYLPICAVLSSVTASLSVVVLPVMLKFVKYWSDVKSPHTLLILDFFMNQLQSCKMAGEQQDKFRRLSTEVTQECQL